MMFKKTQRLPAASLGSDMKQMDELKPGEQPLVSKKPNAMMVVNNDLIANFHGSLGEFSPTKSVGLELGRGWDVSPNSGLLGVLSSFLRGVCPCLTGGVQCNLSAEVGLHLCDVHERNGDRVLAADSHGGLLKRALRSQKIQ